MELSRYWSKDGSLIRCKLCPRKCNIPKDKTGFCNVRKNIDDKLYSLNYGHPIAINLDPIEKKPFYHFHPGTTAFSYGTFGCNFRCKFCCNFDISQAKIQEKLPDVSPEEMVSSALQANAQGIAHTYNEPTMFLEYAYDIAKLAKPKKLYNVFVTNGYAMDAPLKDMKKYLDAVVVDFKGNNEKFYREFAMADVEEVKRGVLKYKKIGVHVEITNLVVPGQNDNLEELRDQIKWINKNLGSNTPYHLLRFFPTPQMPKPDATGIKILENIYDIAKEEGLNYVYIGNVNSKYNNTYCHNCKEPLIQRSHMFADKINLTKDKKCPNCKTKIPIVI